MTKTLPPSPSFRPKRSGVEKSPPLMARAALRQEISRLSVSWERFPLPPISPSPSARDDDVGGHPYRHVKEKVQLRHGTHLRCEGSKGSKGGGLSSRAMSIIMPPFGGHVHIEYHNHSYPRPHRLRWMASHWIRGSRGSPMNPVRLHTLRHFVALFP